VRDAGVSFTVRLRRDAFAKIARLAGFPSDYALAKRMQVNRSTVARVLAGDLQPGPAFIGGALIALAPMSFEDIFEVVETRPAGEGWTCP
jgi:hypothetical protein